MSRLSLCTKKISNNVEITTDARTVWVNGPFACLARFCPVSGEVMIKNGDTFEMNIIPKESFDNWRKRLKEMKNIDVSEEFRPKWESQ